jgi:hypothetical protein
MLEVLDDRLQLERVSRMHQLPRASFLLFRCHLLLENADSLLKLTQVLLLRRSFVAFWLLSGSELGPPPMTKLITLS